METNEEYYKKYIIEANELIEMINSNEKLNQLRVIDGTSYPPLDPRDKNAAFQEKRILYSQFFDIDKIANLESKFPHMMPTNAVFIDHMKNMDIRKSDTIVIYDRVGMFSSPRVWFTFRVFGHMNVRVLNGGFAEWEKANGPIELGNDFKVKSLVREKTSDADYDYHLDETKVLDLNQIIHKSVMISKGALDEEIIDARSEERYLGKAPEPRPSLRVGHVDGAKLVFFKWLLDENWKYKKPKEIEEAFKSKGVDVNKKVTCYCGTGLTACIDLFGLCLIGKYDNCQLYDASWIEIGNVSEEDINKLKQGIKE